jgi:hypothetical protein
VRLWPWQNVATTPSSSTSGHLCLLFTTGANSYADGLKPSA